MPRALDRAANRLAKTTLQDAAAGTVDASEAEVVETAQADGGTDAAGVMTDAVVDIMLARRMYAANLQALQVAHDILRDVVARRE